MLRVSVGVLGRVLSSRTAPVLSGTTAVRTNMSHGESDEEFEKRMTAFFNRRDIDGWDVRRGLQELHGIDGIAEPTTIIAALHAIRRCNDHSLAVRFMETMKDKAGKNVKEIYPYILQEIRPTLDQLGISTPEELGYDKPELALQNPSDMHTY